MAEDVAAPKGQESQAELKAKLASLRTKIKEMEGKTVYGAPSRAQPGDLLDITTLREQNPDTHFRFVNPMDPKKVDSRRRGGFVPVTDAEATAAGVKAKLGNDLILMKQPEEVYNRNVAELARVNKERLEAHKAEVTRAAEEISRQLHDQHGIDVPVERLLVNE